MIVIGAIGLLSGLLLAVLLTRSITHPLSDALAVARTVAANDLTSNIAVRSRDEIGQLMRALQTMNGNLAATVARIRAGVDNIASASGRSPPAIPTCRRAPSSRPRRWNDGGVHGRAVLHRQTERRQRAPGQPAGGGGLGHGVARRRHGESSGVGAMSAISASSVKIADIVSVIDGIAFQTNILALNAPWKRRARASRARASRWSPPRSARWRSAARRRQRRSGPDRGHRRQDRPGFGQRTAHTPAHMRDIVASVQRDRHHGRDRRRLGRAGRRHQAGQPRGVADGRGHAAERRAGGRGRRGGRLHAGPGRRPEARRQRLRLPGGGQVVEVEGEASALPQPSALRLSAS